MRRSTKLTMLGGVAASALLVVAVPSATFANNTVGTATLTGGSLAFLTPTTIAFPAS
jgi:hypothetical protein